MDLYARRKNVNRIALTISVVAATFGLMWLVLILWTLFYEGFNAIDWRIFSEMTPPPGAEGGLRAPAPLGRVNSCAGAVLHTALRYGSVASCEPPRRTPGRVLLSTRR